MHQSKSSKLRNSLLIRAFWKHINGSESSFSVIVIHCRTAYSLVSFKTHQIKNKSKADGTQMSQSFCWRGAIPLMQPTRRLLETSSPCSCLLWADLWRYWWAVPACVKLEREVDQLMCSRAAFKELEALSNPEGFSHCYPFNYVVWVSTVVNAEPGWGRSGRWWTVFVSFVRVCVYMSVWVQGFGVSLSFLK